MNLQIQINEKIIKRYKDYGLSVDYLGSVLIILFALYEGEIDILNAMDDGNKERRIVMLYQYLTRRGFLEPSDDTLYVLTERGIEFIKFCESCMETSRSVQIGG